MRRADSQARAGTPENGRRVVRDRPNGRGARLGGQAGEKAEFDEFGGGGIDGEPNWSSASSRARR